MKKFLFLGFLLGNPHLWGMTSVKIRRLGSNVINTIKKGDVDTLRDLIRNDLSLLREDSMEIMLNHATANGSVACGRYLLKRGARPHKQDGKGKTSLHHAVRYKLLPMVKLFMAHNPACCLLRDFKGWNPLHYASALGSREIVEGVLADNIESKTAAGETALVIAASKNHEEVIDLLLSKGATVSENLRQSSTVFFVAAQGGYLKVLRLLLENGIDVQQTDTEGFSALHRALWHNQSETALMLLDNKADTTCRDAAGRIPLHSAVMKAGAPLVGKLLTLATLNVQDGTGNTPFHLAIIYGRDDLIDLLWGCKPNVTIDNTDGNTPLHEAALRGLVDVIEKILSLVASPEELINRKNKQGNSACHLAALCGHEPVVVFLFERGANVQEEILQKEDDNGDIPIFVAIECKNLRVFRKFLKLVDGASITNNKGQTLLHKALEVGWFEGIKVLVQRNFINDTRDKGESTGWFTKRKTPLSVAVESRSKFVRPLLATEMSEKDLDTLMQWNEIVRKLIASGADTKALANQSCTYPLMVFVKNDQTKKVSQLVEREGGVIECGIHTGQSHSYSALTEAMVSGCDATVRVLLDDKASINSIDFERRTPLHWAVIKAPKGGSISSERRNSISLLLSADCIDLDCKAKDSEGNTALHYALNVSSDVVKLLLDSDKCGANVQNAKEMTVLHLAIVNCLEKFDAEVYLGNKVQKLRIFTGKGSRVSDWKYQKAVKAEEGAVEAARNALSMLNLIIDHPRIDVNSTGKFNRTPLHYAVASPHIVGLLLKRKGIEVNAKDREGNTPLHAAVLRHASSSSDDVVTLLLDFGKCDVNVQNKRGRTPLHYAVASSLIVGCLLKQTDIKVNAKDREGNTPLHAAVLHHASSSSDVVKLLLDLEKCEVNLTDR